MRAAFAAEAAEELPFLLMSSPLYGSKTIKRADVTRTESKLKASSIIITKNKIHFIARAETKGNGIVGIVVIRDGRF